MVKKLLCVLGISTLFITSCAVDEVVNQGVENNLVLISAQIESEEPNSRAQIGIDGKGYFLNGDEITLIYGNKDTNLKLEDGKWLPKLDWNEIASPTEFVGFYPTVPTSANLFVHCVEPNQNLSNNFEKSDLLCAKTDIVNKGDEVNLNFKHLMSCITIKLKSNKFTQQELESATIKIRAYNQVKVGLSGELGKTLDHKDGIGDIPVITMHHKGNGVYQAVICPYNFRTITYSGAYPWLEMTIAGKTVSKNDPPKYLNNNIPFDSYESGKNVTFTFSFNEKDPKYSNKLCWVEGLTNMPDPLTSDKWIIISPESTKKQLLWEKSYGWYDCNKVSLTDLSKDDSNMCWAATASNMIHWWFDRNRKNVDDYCKLNNIEPSSIPQQYPNHLSSEVFQVFKDKFENKGGHSNQGMRWYFIGEYVKINDAAELINPNVPSGGYFKSVIPSDEVCEYKPILNMKDLTAALKYAFDNQMAIGFSVNMPAFGHHAMTMWGAKFDEYGRPCAIYFTDNNDGAEGQEAYGLITANVGEYNGDTKTEAQKALVGRACMEGSIGKNTIEFTGMYFLSMHKNAWTKYFETHSK